MKRTQLIALIVCLLSGTVLAGTIVAKRAWFGKHGDGLNQAQGEYDSSKPFPVNYNDLRVIEPFVLTERSDQPFDSTELDGKVYVASFFFASCPVICREQNNKIAEIIAELPNRDVTFVSISVDPKNDTPLKLREYARGFGADEKPWYFLTGEMETIENVGNQFALSVGEQTHGSSLLLVDKWGRFRDRFSIDDTQDLARMKPVLERVAAETEAPFGAETQTRAIPRIRADKVAQSEFVYAHGDWNAPGKVMQEFLLTERSGERIDSRDLLGKTWVASFFFSRCPSICKQQNMEISRLAERCKELGLTFVSISCDTPYDTPPVLREYAKQFSADQYDWLFLTGEQLQVERVGEEMFSMPVGLEQHSSKLVLVDRWGNVRGKFSWDDEKSMSDFRVKADQVVNEKSAPDKATLDAEAAADQPVSDVPGSDELDDE